MQGIDQVDAFVVSDPSIIERGTDLSFPLVAGRLLGRRRVIRRMVVAALHGVGAMENCEFRLGPNARARENFRERRAGPFADATPALHAIMSGDLRAWGKGAKIGEGKIERFVHQPIHTEPPIGKVTPGKKLIVFIRRVSRTVRFEIWRDVGVAELASKPVGAEEHPLCTIRDALGRIENAASRRTFGDAIASCGQAAEANRSPTRKRRRSSRFAVISQPPSPRL